MKREKYAIIRIKTPTTMVGSVKKRERNWEKLTEAKTPRRRMSRKGSSSMVKRKREVEVVSMKRKKRR